MTQHHQRENTSRLDRSLLCCFLLFLHLWYNPLIWAALPLSSRADMGGWRFNGERRRRDRHNAQIVSSLLLTAVDSFCIVTPSLYFPGTGS